MQNTEENYFEKLYKCSSDSSDKLSWAESIKKLRLIHPDSNIEVVKFPDNNGNLCFPYLKTDLGYFVEVKVTVNGISHSKLSSININYRPTPNQVNNAIKETTVECIAMHGLGLSYFEENECQVEEKKNAISELRKETVFNSNIEVIKNPRLRALARNTKNPAPFLALNKCKSRNEIKRLLYNWPLEIRTHVLVKKAVKIIEESFGHFELI